MGVLGKRKYSTSYESKDSKRQRVTTRDRMLKWNEHYSSTNFGIWIECTKCEKWRKSFQYNESHEVPDNWSCSMNITGEGNPASCDDAEEKWEEEYLEYAPGSVVWAKLDGYPWWPGMVDEDPDLEEYFWQDSSTRSSYNVTFLDDSVTHAWVETSHISPFLKPPRRKGFQMLLRKYSSAIFKAEEKARAAMEMTIKERLDTFSFAHTYKGKWGFAADYDNMVDEDLDITDILLKEVDDLSSVGSFDDLDYDDFAHFLDTHEDFTSSQKTNKEKIGSNHEKKKTKSKTGSKFPKIKKIISQKPIKKEIIRTTNKIVKVSDSEGALEDKESLSSDTGMFSFETSKIPPTDDGKETVQNVPEAVSTECTSTSCISPTPESDKKLVSRLKNENVESESLLKSLDAKINLDETKENTTESIASSLLPKTNDDHGNSTRDDAHNHTPTKDVPVAEKFNTVPDVALQEKIAPISPLPKANDVKNNGFQENKSNKSKNVEIIENSTVGDSNIPLTKKIVKKVKKCEKSKESKKTKLGTSDDHDKDKEDDKSSTAVKSIVSKSEKPKKIKPSLCKDAAKKEKLNEKQNSVVDNGTSKTISLLEAKAPKPKNEKSIKMKTNGDKPKLVKKKAVKIAENSNSENTDVKKMNEASSKKLVKNSQKLSTTQKAGIAPTKIRPTFKPFKQPMISKPSTHVLETQIKEELMDSISSNSNSDILIGEKDVSISNKLNVDTSLVNDEINTEKRNFNDEKSQDDARSHAGVSIELEPAEKIKHSTMNLFKTALQVEMASPKDILEENTKTCDFKHEKMDAEKAIISDPDSTKSNNDDGFFDNPISDDDLEVIS